MSIISYFKETKEEFRHVTWLSRNQALVYTMLIVVVSLIVGYMLGLFDSLFSFGLKTLLGN